MMRRLVVTALALTAGAAKAQTSAQTSAATPPGLVAERDWDTLNDLERGQYSDVFCAAAVDAAALLPGHDAVAMKKEHAFDHDMFVAHGGQDADFEPNVAAAATILKGQLDRGETTLDDVLQDCGSN